MKLTRRQEEFIISLHELTQELDGPIHYSAVAERLGVSPITAYDMLCVLEHKGMATSEYQQRSAPGRAERVFYPSDSAYALKQHFLEKVSKQAFEEQGFNQRFLEKIRESDPIDRELFNQMLARIPPDVSDGQVKFCIELMTVISLHLQHSEGRHIFLRYLPQLLSDPTLVNPTHLSMLAGFGCGVLAQEGTSDQTWMNTLLEYVEQYNHVVAQMDANQIKHLWSYLLDLFAPFSHESVESIDHHPKSSAN